MKAYEISKNKADIPHGRVLIAIEGQADAVDHISCKMQSEGYSSTKCSEAGDIEGEIVEFFIIARADKSDFMRTYKQYK